MQISQKQAGTAPQLPAGRERRHRHTVDYSSPWERVKVASLHSLGLDGSIASASGADHALEGIAFDKTGKHRKRPRAHSLGAAAEWAEASQSVVRGDKNGVRVDHVGADEEGTHGENR